MGFDLLHFDFIFLLSFLKQFFVFGAEKVIFIFRIDRLK
jgi:hypothetical protein